MNSDCKEWKPLHRCVHSKPGSFYPSFALNTSRREGRGINWSQTENSVLVWKSKERENRRHIAVRVSPREVMVLRRPPMLLLPVIWWGIETAVKMLYAPQCNVQDCMCVEWFADINDWRKREEMLCYAWKIGLYRCHYSSFRWGNPRYCSNLASYSAVVLVPRWLTGECGMNVSAVAPVWYEGPSISADSIASNSSEVESMSLVARDTFGYGLT